MAEGVTFFKINNFNDNLNKNDEFKKSKTFKEEKIFRLNIPYRLNNGQNHLGTVLETINEVSNSIIDSSEISDEKNENKNENKNNKININTIVKSNENKPINDSWNIEAYTKKSLMPKEKNMILYLIYSVDIFFNINEKYNYRVFKT